MHNGVFSARVGIVRLPQAAQDSKKGYILHVPHEHYASSPGNSFSPFNTAAHRESDISKSIKLYSALYLPSDSTSYPDPISQPVICAFSPTLTLLQMIEPSIFALCRDANISSC